MYLSGIFFVACGGKAVDSPSDDADRMSNLGEGDVSDPSSTGGGGAFATSGGAAGIGGGPFPQGGSAMGGAGGVPNTGGALTTGGAVGAGGTSGAGGEVMGTGGGATRLDAPWESLYGHYDLTIVPEDAECDGLKGHVNFSLRLGENGPEARIFRNFEWNGWPDAVVEDADNSGLWIVPGAGESLDEAVTPEGLFFPYDEGGFVMPGVPSGRAVVKSTCEGDPVEQPAVISIRPDETSPHVREQLYFICVDGLCERAIPSDCQ